MPLPTGQRDLVLLSLVARPDAGARKRNGVRWNLLNPRKWPGPPDVWGN